MPNDFGKLLATLCRLIKRGRFCNYKLVRSGSRATIQGSRILRHELASSQKGARELLGAGNLDTPDLLEQGA
ncbi:unnamed protein product [Ciceribacter selenitireducens ATCC BAA-1503]|uniref:Uncharacterized protein n=1 Tax=Ciceribacter selenitireducens ATCC BAA-1503 TaxID=1336235 RepID=A0A376AEM8_9HYPH|nr:unnamed protein product [Ciceribacter selenitireducens ATCC BAA-1503]